MRYPAHQSNYEQTIIHQADYPVAWKALPSGSPTTVLAQVDQEVSFPPGVVFRQNDNSVSSQPGSAGHQQQLTLTGQAHQQEGSLLVYASAEEDISDFTKRTDMEWVVEMYGPYSSGQMIKAHGAGELAKVANWINRELKNYFDVDGLKAIGRLSEDIPRTKDGRIPVAILKHYPKAKHQEKLIVYYTEKNPQGGLRPAEKPLVFSPPYPVDLSLHTGEFDAAGEKAAPMKEETVEAFGHLAYDFVWKTMTEQNMADRIKNYLKEVWDYSNVGQDKGMVFQLLQDIISEKTAEDMSYTHEKDIIYSYGIEMEGSDASVPIAVYVLQKQGLAPKSSDLIDLVIDKQKHYTVLAFCADQDKTKPQLLVQIANEHVEVFKRLFASSSPKKLADGTLLGDPVPKMRITSSGMSGIEGGRFGCTRTNKKMTCGGVKGKKYHGGLDIHATIGTEIRSIRKGTVFAAPTEEQLNLGHYVIIKSELPDEKVLYILYAHLVTI